MRFAAAFLFFATVLSAAEAGPRFTESAEFPYAAIPAHLWERDLIWLKTTGIEHISLPPAKDPDGLIRVIAIIRALTLEADLEGPVPPTLEPLLKTHGGPLTEPLSATPVRISVLASDALSRATALSLTPGRTTLWTDLFDTLSGSTFHTGAVSFTGAERPVANSFRRHALLTRYWGHLGTTIRAIPGAQPVNTAPLVTVRQYSARVPGTFVLATNNARAPWTGDIRAAYIASRRYIAIPAVTIPSLETMRLPVNIPLMSGPLCRDCTGFATTDHLIYATAELTTMEYENGILAMEFYAPAQGEALLQLHREPSGPLIGGGRLKQFTWDGATKRLHLTIPAGPAPGHHIRIAIAIDGPDATAFFPSAKVLLIGEENRLTAQYSGEGVSQRSRLLASAGIHTSRDAVNPATPLESLFRITPGPSLIDGDTGSLVIEADGIRLSHAEPRLRKPATLSFGDGVGVRLAANSTLALYPTTIPVNQKAGREVTVTIHNNAPEIRTFQLELKAEGIEFSPATAEVTVGYGAQRPVTFRTFTTNAAPGLHTGEAHLTGAATVTEPVRFVVLPQNTAVAWSADGFFFLENLRQRATFLPGHWLEFIGKDNGRDALPAGGTPFAPGTLKTSGEELMVTGPTIKAFRLKDLESLVPKPGR